jgi:hypothetical protein
LEHFRKNATPELYEIIKKHGIIKRNEYTPNSKDSRFLVEHDGSLEPNPGFTT